MTGPQISQENYDAAAAQWVTARRRLEAARTELHVAQVAEQEANEALSAQEAYPGIPAWWHAQQVAAVDCRLQSCSVHPDSERYPGQS